MTRRAASRVALLVVVLSATGCAPTQVRPGQDLTALEGKRVALDGELSIPTAYATGRADPAGWCLTLSHLKPEVRHTSDLAFGVEVVPVQFRDGQAPPSEATPARVVGVVAREGTTPVLRDATWRSMK